MNSVSRVLFVSLATWLLFPALVSATTLLSSGVFQAGPVTCSGFSTTTSEITIPAHCLTGLDESVAMRYTDIDTGTIYEIAKVDLVLIGRDVAILSLKETLFPGDFPSHVIHAELQGQFLEKAGYVLYDLGRSPGDSGMPVIRGTDVVGMHIGNFNGYSIAVLFGTDDPLPQDVVLGIQRQFYCGADCEYEECVKVGGFKKCASFQDPVCAAARDTHCALLALLDLLRSELSNLRDLLTGKQSTKNTWQQTVESTQDSVDAKSAQLGSLNSSITSTTTAVNNTQTAINQTTSSITSTNNQITSTISTQNITTSSINANQVVKSNDIATLGDLNNSINATNLEITFNTNKISELEIVKSSEEATKVVREQTFSADQLTGTTLIQEIKELNTVSVGIIGQSLPEVQKTVVGYLSEKDQGVADFVNAGMDLLIKTNSDLAENYPTPSTVTNQLEQIGSGYEKVMDNAINAGLTSREHLTALAKDVPLLGPLEERITKELNGEGILRSDKDFWEAVISENSETAKFSNWLAQADSKTQTWFAERDEATQEYFADRDEAFRDFVDDLGGWPEEADKFGDLFSENFKEGNNKISISYKNTGKELSEGSKAIQAELEFVLKSCTADLGTTFREFSFQANGVTTDLMGLMNLDASAGDGLVGAQALFGTSIGTWFNKMTTKCFTNASVPEPIFKSPIKPKLLETTKSQLREKIIEITTKLYKDVEGFPVTGVPSWDNNEFIYPEDREFPGICGGLITEKGNFSFHLTTHLRYQNAAVDFLTENNRFARNLCNNGDGIKFTGLLYSVDPIEKFRAGIRDSFDTDGRPHRSKYHKEIHHEFGKAGGAYSKDMTMGLNFYFASSHDRELASRFHSFITNSSNFACDILPSFHPNLAHEKVIKNDDGSETIEVIKWASQFGNCYLTPSILNNFERVRRHIGLDSTELNRLQFLIDVEIIRQAAGLPESQEFSAVRVQLWDLYANDIEIGKYLVKQRINEDKFYQDSLDFELHLASLNILLFSELGLLTQGLADAAEKISERWHTQADVNDFKLENLFFRFMDNYTNSGSEGEYERIAQKLIQRMDCWGNYRDPSKDNGIRTACWDIEETDIKLSEEPLKDPSGNVVLGIDGEPFYLELFDWRQGWSWQRKPPSGDKRERYLLNQTATPYGHDLVFLAKILLRGE